MTTDSAGAHSSTGPPPATPAALRAAVLGPVLLAGEDGYDEERSGFELGVERRPEVIVGARGTADVIAAVRFAAARRMPVAVLATGHGPSAPMDGGVLVSTRRMTGVRVDPLARTARIEAGTPWERVIHESAVHGLVPPSGAAPAVGAVSYLLGGGLGLLSRRYGTGSAHVVAFDLVTADGRLLQVSADRHPDLFWAVRGSKDNLGIVTSVEVRLFPVPEIYGGGLYFDGATARDVLEGYLARTAQLPDEVASSVLLMRFPDSPALPPALAGRHIAHVRLAFLGGAREGERHFAPLRETGRLLLDTIGPVALTETGTIHGDPTEPLHGVSRTLMVRRPDPAAIDAIIDLAGPDADAPYGVELRHLAGALARPPAAPCAAGHYPEAEFNVYLTSALPPGAAPTVVDAAQQRLVDALAPWAVPELCVNFLVGADAAAGRVRSAYPPADYARLQAIKARYDPDNTFRLNLNIPPA
ncbi:FAD-binding oxidoreductase [Kitasatospora sp. NPDC049258]|uniref:FAD-binding oxidoreductase n=1 Tax=Kitasatospora sp. NPDC049258 TaxID=3155394 RepID=UPI00343D3476